MRKAVKEYFELLKMSGLDELILDQTSSFSNMDSFSLLEEKKIASENCRKCPLCNGRRYVVFGEGSANAKTMIIGEGPGADEDSTGRPFIGKAGQLLTKMLAAIKLDRSEVYITNIVKCRPPGNRNPLPTEINACLPYLLEQIEIIKPQVILLLGKVAATTLFQKPLPLNVFRTKVNSFKNIPTFVTYHPAALLRNPEWKRDAWVDLQKFQKFYDNLP